MTKESFSRIFGIGRKLFCRQVGGTNTGSGCEKNEIYVETRNSTYGAVHQICTGSIKVNQPLIDHLPRLHSKVESALDRGCHSSNTSGSFLEVTILCRIPLKSLWSMTLKLGLQSSPFISNASPGMPNSSSRVFRNR